MRLPDDIAINISFGCDPVFRCVDINEVDKQDFFAKFGISRPFIFYSGGADGRKNLHRLIRAYAGLSGDLKKSHQLVLAGNISGDEVTALRQTAKTAGVQKDQLLCAGYVTDEELVMFY